MIFVKTDAFKEIFFHSFIILLAVLSAISLFSISTSSAAELPENNIQAKSYDTDNTSSMTMLNRSIIAGDLNGNGKVDITDAILCIRQVMGTFTPDDLYLANMNGDKSVDMSDAMLIFRASAGLANGEGSNQKPVYDYNSDGGAVQIINNNVVNTYPEIQNNLDTLRNDKEAFIEFFKIFELSLLDSSGPDTGAPPEIDNRVPSYAPTGDQQEMTVTVKDNKIDYSDYTLKGDVNNDYAVDLADLDLIKDTIYDDTYNQACDVNHDNKVDLKDLVFASARLLTEIKYYDFYTPDGNKLPIPTRNITMPKIFSYNISTTTKIMVVAKDENMASSFETGLSDLDDAWYKKKGLQYTDENTIYYDNDTDSPAKATGNAITMAYTKHPLSTFTQGEVLQKAVNHAVEAAPEAYLCGWNLTVKYLYRGNYQEQDYGIQGFDGLFNSAIAKITPHFKNADMGNPGKVIYHTRKEFIYRIGQRIGKTNKISASEIGFKNINIAKDGTTIKRKYIVEAYSVLFISNPIHTLQGTIEGDPPFKGKIILHRTGPTPAVKDFTTTINKGKFTINNLPYGVYAVKAETECGCQVDLSQHFIFDDKTQSISIKNPNDAMQKVYLTLAVLDKDNKPMKNASVQIISDECVSSSITEQAITDADGNVRFEDLDTGNYTILVNGKVQKTLHICSNTNEVVKINDTKLWRLKVDFSNSCVQGSIILKKFILDFDKPMDLHDGEDTYAAVGNDFIDFHSTADSVQTVDVYYTGGLAYDSGLSPLYITSKGITINMVGKNYCDSSLPVQVGSIILDGTSYGHAPLDRCIGDFPAGKLTMIKEGEKVNWSSDGTGGAGGTFTLEPCKDEECNPY